MLVRVGALAYFFSYNAAILLNAMDCKSLQFLGNAMLEWMQRHKKYLVATVWISALALIFAGLVEWGGGGFSAGGRDVVAKVGGLEVNRYDYERQLDFIKNMYGITSEEEAKLLGLDTEALGFLVRARLLELVASDMGVGISSDEVLDNLTKIPVFQVNNRFSKEAYLTFLKQRGQRAEAFEGLVGKELLNEKMQNFPLFTPSGLEFDSMLTASNVADDLSVLLLNKQDVLKGEVFDLSDSKIEEFWAKNSASYYDPATYRLAYVLVDSKLVPLQPESLAQFFNENKSRYAPDALDKQDETLLRDYRIGEARLYAQLASSFMDTNLRGDLKEGMAIPSLEHSYDLKKLDKKHVLLLQEHLASAEAIPVDSIPISYAQISEASKDIYPQLLATLASAGANGAKLEVMEFGDLVLAPYLISKIDRIPLEFAKVKDRVARDALEQEKKNRFLELANAMLPKAFDNPALQHLGFVTAADSLPNPVNRGPIVIPARGDLKLRGLEASEVKYLISQVFDSLTPTGAIPIGEDKIALYVVKRQKLLDTADLLNAPNDAIDSVTESKTAAMRDALFEYAASRYKITDYRRRD